VNICRKGGLKMSFMEAFLNWIINLKFMEEDDLIECEEIKGRWNL
jgi:hypothetical protein